jgi:putative transposase
MARKLLSDAMWEQLAAGLAEVKDPRGAPAGLPEREFVEAVLFLARTGLPWRDLPEAFGQWSAVYMRFRRWEKAGVWRGLWAVLARGATPVLLKVFVDSTSIPVHPHAAGAPKKTARIRLWAARAAA